MRLTLDRPLLLRGKIVQPDWQHGTCKVLVGARPDTQDEEAFRTAIQAWLVDERKRAPQGLDGVIVWVAENFLVYWEHWYDTAQARRSRIKSLAKLVKPVLLENATSVNLSAPFETDYAGAEIAGGECFNLRFQRLSLA